MPRNPDLPCADCGKLLWRSATSLPPGQARCQPCRRLRPVTTVTSKPQVCQQCGNDFASTVMQRTCSASCGQLLRYTASPFKRECEVCGEPYKATCRKQRTCGRTCGVALRRASGKPWAPRERKSYPVCHVRPGECQQCGALFVSRGQGQPRKTCSRLCHDRLQQASRLALAVEQRRCPQCSQDFSCASNSTRRYCTEQCAKRRMRTDRRHYRERARRAGVAYEPINKRKVFERDKWRCGICKRKVNPKLTYPHPMSVSLDHIIPMSLGGPHWYVNVQCSHLQCNVDKSNGSAGEQLALVG